MVGVGFRLEAELQSEYRKEDLDGSIREDAVLATLLQLDMA